jgi:hypothetical protein
MTDDTQILAHPAVEAFVDEVRARLDDLTAEQREELLDGLAADLTEQLADGADAVLDDPVAYAAELRAAAGLPEGRGRRLPRLNAPTRQRVEDTLDRARERWLARVDDGQVWEVVEAMRPAWWVARAWVAVTFLDQVAGQGEPVSLLPSLGIPGLGAGLLAAAVVVSVLIGLDRLWPGSGQDRPLLARLVLVALNAAALLLPLGFGISSPGYLSGQPDNDYDDYANYDQGYRAATRDLSAGGLRSDGEPVRNVFAYDVKGRPLQGVQLFDQEGRPLDIASRQAQQGHDQSRRVGCAWRNGTSPQYNVFPLAERLQEYGPCTWTEGTGRLGSVALPAPPLFVVPPVVLPEGVPEPAVESARPHPRKEPESARPQP